MKNKFITFLFTFTLVNFSAIAVADSALVGAAYKCEKNNFALYGTVESTGGDIPAPPKTQQLKVGTNNLSCTINDSTIEVRVSLLSPGRNGICGDPGRVYVDTIKVNGREVFDPEPVLFYCFSEPSITSINIFPKDNSLIIDVCRGNWEWGDDYKNLKCEKQYVTEP